MAEDALAVLMNLSRQGRGGADVLELSRLRGQRRSELVPRAEAGDPLAINRLSTLDEEIADDPFVGDEAATRLADTRQQLDEAAMFQRPEIAAMRREQEGSALRRLVLPARAKAEAAASQDAINFAQQLMRDRLMSADIGQRQAASQAATSRRAAGTQQAQMQRAQLNDLMRQRLNAQKEMGKIGMVGRMFGRAKPFEQQIAQLSQQISGLGTGLQAADDGFDPAEAAQILAARFPNASLQDLMNEATFDSPAEAEAFQAMLTQLGYR